MPLAPKIVTNLGMMYGMYDMVFGWGRKKPPEAPQVHAIQLDEAIEVVKKTHRMRAERTITEAGNLVHRTNTLIRELVQIRKDLEKDDLKEEEMDARVKPLVIKGKKMLIDALRMNAVEIRPIHNYEDMVRANEELEHRLKRMGNILGKQTRIIHIFAEKYAIRLKQILEEVEENRKQVLSTTTWHKNDTELAETVTGGIQDVHNMEALIKDNEQKIRNSEQERTDIESGIESAQSKIVQFKESSEYDDWLTHRNSLEQYKRNRLALKTDISTQFTKISRPLGRYSRISADKEQSALLKKMLDDPYDTIRSAEGKSVFTLLEGVRKATSSGSISVKDVGKALDAITQTQEAVSQFIEKINAIETDIQKTIKAIDDTKPTRLYLLEEEIHNLEGAQELAHKKINDIHSSTEKTKKAIPLEIKKIHNALEDITGTRYDIKYTAP